MAFSVEILKSTRVGGESTHTPVRILKDSNHVASAVNVEMDDGRRFIRIFDYDVPLKAELDAYFSSRKGVNEVSFSRPFTM